MNTMDRPNKIAFIDTETTGLSHLSRPWEIAVILRETSTIEAPELATAQTRYFQGATIETEHVFHVDYTWRTFPDGTDPKALDIGGWARRGFGAFGELTRAQLDREGVRVAAGAEWAIAPKIHALLQDATIVGVGVHYDTEVLGRMFLRHGLPWQPWHYGILDMKTAGWGFMRGYAGALPDDGETGDDTDLYDQIPVKSERIAKWVGVEPPRDEERHTALGDARWARRWFDEL